jgi:hypothetical protein
MITNKITKNKAKVKTEKNNAEVIEKINSNTPYDFDGKQMTPYGGLLPLASLMEKTGFEKLCAQLVHTIRKTIAMKVTQFFVSIIISLYIGFDRLNHVRYIRKDPLITRLLGVKTLPVQSTYWRLLQSFTPENEKEFKEVNTEMMKRVWQIANIQLKKITIDTDTTVHTVYGEKEESTVGYNPKNRGKRSYQPVLSFIAETGEYISGENRSGDRMSGKEIAEHLEEVFNKIPEIVTEVRCRADAGFYCQETIEKYEEKGSEFIVVAQKTPKLANLLEFGGLQWEAKKGTKGIVSFYYQPQGWKKSYRFIAARYPLEEKEEQYQLFATEKFKYRVFVTNMKGKTWKLIKFYDGRAGAENLIKEANNDAGIASIPSKQLKANNNFFQLMMLTYNFNRWLQMLSIEEGEKYIRRQLSTVRLQSLFIAAKIVKHSNQIRISYSEHYPEQNKYNNLMARILRIRNCGGKYLSVIRNPVAIFCC